jgi:hypothetical protein
MTNFKAVPALAKYLLSVSILLSASAISAQDASSGSEPEMTENTKVDIKNTKIEAEEVAKKLANPIANMVSVPFQYDYYGNIGPEKKGSAQILLTQPVIPIGLKGGDNIIMRPVVTSIWENNLNGFSGYGFNNVTLETFYTPNTGSSVMYGVGPVLVSPSGTSGHFGSQQTGGGVTGVVLDRKGPWTYGAMAYQTWSLGGNGASGTQNNFYYQPFLAYVTHNAWTFTVVDQGNYNYDQHKAVNTYFFNIGKLVVHHKLPVNYTAGVSYMGTTTPGGPQGFGARAQITFAFPE